MFEGVVSQVEVHTEVLPPLVFDTTGAGGGTKNEDWLSRLFKPRVVVKSNDVGVLWDWSPNGVPDPNRHKFFQLLAAGVLALAAYGAWKLLK